MIKSCLLKVIFLMCIFNSSSDLGLSIKEKRLFEEHLLCLKSLSHTVLGTFPSTISGTAKFFFYHSCMLFIQDYFVPL